MTFEIPERFKGNDVAFIYESALRGYRLESASDYRNNPKNTSKTIERIKLSNGRLVEKILDINFLESRTLLQGYVDNLDPTIKLIQEDIKLEDIFGKENEGEQ